MISVNEPSLGAEEVRAAASVLKDGSLTTAARFGGRHVREFESAAASFVGAKYSVAVNSGTAALQASLLALDVKGGDEVIIPSFTFVATANAVLSVGARPVFADIAGDNYTIDPADVEKKITRKTRAVIPVHLYGNVADVGRISEVAKRNGLPVVEDAAQSLGSTYRKRHTGTFFELGCFSMYPSKVMTSGEGGFVVTNNKNLCRKLQMIRNHGIGARGPQMFGLNLRLSEIGAAIASAQMKKLPRLLNARRRNAARLTELISDLDVRIPSEPSHVRTNWSLYTIAATGRNRIQKSLQQKGIGAAVYYNPPVHRTPFYKSPAALPATEWASRHVLSLPVHPQVTEQDIRHIARSLRAAV